MDMKNLLITATELYNTLYKSYDTEDNSLTTALAIKIDNLSERCMTLSKILNKEIFNEQTLLYSIYLLNLILSEQVAIVKVALATNILGANIIRVADQHNIGIEIEGPINIGYNYDG